MSESKVANGNIVPSRFVKPDGATLSGKVIMASANSDLIFGISQAGTRQAPYTGLDDGFCAIAGENLKVYTFPDKEVLLELGSGGCNAGDYLTADANGAGVVTTTTGQFVGARAKQSGLAGSLIPVDCLQGTAY